ncbi:MAG: hypothetical protein H8E55_52305 [Pelagibacterales bacterium]|nr:hypothetical protein [Pelagibacterales bacterium]
MKKILLILIIPFIFSSCYVHKVSHGNGSVQGYTKTDKQHNFLFGIISERSPIIEEIKNEKNYEIEIKITPADGVISFLTFGLYVPTTITVKK